MAFPEYEDLEDPLLCYVFLNGGTNYTVPPESTYKPLADFFKIPEREIDCLHNEFHQWQRRIQWAHQGLVNCGDFEIECSKNGLWRLSEQGVKRASIVSGKYRHLKRNNSSD